MADPAPPALNECCGVFACVMNGDPFDGTSSASVAQLICSGLNALQHRGQESAGIVTSDGSARCFAHERGKGLVASVFSEEKLARFKGATLGIGHTRYSTAGVKDALNCVQPFVVYCSAAGQLALSHNGELVNAKQLRRKVLKTVGLSTDTDSELICQLLATAPCIQRHSEGAAGGEPDWGEALRHVMSTELSLSYSLAVLTRNAVYAARDPFGNRPLCLGAMRPAPSAGGCGAVAHCDVAGWLVSSESCAFQGLGAELLRELEPGEIVEIRRGGLPTTLFVVTGTAAAAGLTRISPALCVFEYIYFSRADSVLGRRVQDGQLLSAGQQVHAVRRRCGEALGREAPIDSKDAIVSTIPESATPAALGYAAVTGIAYTEVLCRNRYVGRTFIAPSDELRKAGVGSKFGALSANFVRKRVVLVDDSIVRGNTIGPVVQLLKRCGAAEVHVRIASPPVRNPCYMGINIPTKEELIANRMQLGGCALLPGQNVGQLAEFLGADSVVYLSLPGLQAAVSEKLAVEDAPAGGGHCMACMNGNYPVQPDVDW